jgi:hypothetical protein
MCELKSDIVVILAPVVVPDQTYIE